MSVIFNIPHCIFPVRPITKIFLLAVVAFVVYLLWPRTGDLKAFQPAEMAKLAVANWQAQKQGKPFDAFLSRFQIYSSQYRFGPVPAFRIAQSQDAGLSELKISRAQGGDATNENRSLQAFTEQYVWIKKQANLDFDPDSLAREEFTWRTMVLDARPESKIVEPYAKILAGLYGGAPKDFEDVAAGLVHARALIFSDTPPADGTDPVEMAKGLALEAYTLLKEIASTPVPAPQP